LNTTPAIVTQAGAARLPRLALLSLCLVYVLAGFVGRSGWKFADMGALGYMAELAWGHSDWWHPTLAGIPSEQGALLPYWLGAWMLQWGGSGLEAQWLARIPFVIALAVAMAAHWYGTYYLARSPMAQPVAFAFGGQADTTDYARSIADGGLLALIACLGLAPMAHETSPELIQMAFVGIFLSGVSALPWRPQQAWLALVVSLVGLAISGAPSLAVIFGAGATVFELYQLFLNADHTPRLYRAKAGIAVLVVSTLACATIASGLDLWRWKLDNPLHLASPWQGYMELLLWFTWPAWPLALWTMWVWRRQLWSLHASRHLALPLLVVIAVLVASWCMHSSEHTLLLALPALSSLAAFALPTLKRQVASLIDWFTLIFFTGWGLVLWVHFIAMFTGIPANPAINIARLAPDFEAQFSWLALCTASVCTVAWGLLVHWRVGRHRRELWRSLVLPAGGIAWCWALMMTMGISLFDYTQSYERWVALVTGQVSAPGCVRSEQLNIGEIAALRWIGKLPISAPTLSNDCPWLLIAPGPNQTLPAHIDKAQWAVKALVLHPADNNIGVWVLQRR